MAKKQPFAKQKVKGTRKPRVKNQTINIVNIEESKNYMNDLIKAATDFFKEATIFFAKKNGTLEEVLAPVAAPVKEAVQPAAAAEPAAAEPKTRGRKKETPAPAEDPLAALGLPAAVAPAPAPKPLTEAETYKLLMDTATAYVTHFGQPKGIAQAKAHLKPYSLEKITDLKHEQRLPYIKTLQDELAKAGA